MAIRSNGWRQSNAPSRTGAVLSTVLAAAPAPATPQPPRALELSSTGSGLRVSAEVHVLTNAHVVEGCAEDAVFRQGRGVRRGAAAVVVGHPLRGALASGANVTFDNVSALADPGDDWRLIRIAALSDELLAPGEVAAKAMAFSRSSWSAGSNPCSCSAPPSSARSMVAPVPSAQGAG